MMGTFIPIISEAHLSIIAIPGFLALLVARLVHADERIVAIAVKDTLAAEGAPAAGSAADNPKPAHQAERGD
jgi:hypothetical protein